MTKKIKQISISEAMDLSKSGRKVYVIPSTDKPTIKLFNNMSVGDVLDENNEYIFIVFDEFE